MVKDKKYYCEITPPKGLLNIDWHELWRFRELFYIFTWRDIKVRYKQTAIGIIWAIFQPLMTMLIFTLFFGVLAKVPSEGVPYPIFVYVGLLLWNYFSLSLSSSSNSLVANQAIMNKVYFPRIILPITATLVGLVDFFVASLVLLGLMAFFHYTPHWQGFLLTPLLILMTMMTTIGIGLFLASLNVKYRDVNQILPFFIQILLFLTPVIYPPTLLPAKYQWILQLNPMTGIISAARAGILGQAPINWQSLGISAVIIIVLFLFGLFYFRRTERYFSDII